MLFLRLFSCSCVFRSSFCSSVIGFISCFILNDGLFCTHSLDPRFLALGKFQAWNWFWYPLTCATRGGVGVRYCAWSRTLDPNVFPCRSLNLGPLTWHSIARPPSTPL